MGCILFVFVVVTDIEAVGLQTAAGQSSFLTTSAGIICSIVFSIVELTHALTKPSILTPRTIQQFNHFLNFHYLVLCKWLFAKLIGNRLTRAVIICDSSFSGSVSTEMLLRLLIH